MKKNNLKILLTNDDGLDSFSTFNLAEQLRTLGHEVYIVTPMENMSSISGAISIKKNIFMIRHDEFGVAVTGTPNDCINIAAFGNIFKNNKFDLVISGINHGENAGQTIYYSGTVAAAIRAKLVGYNSISASYKSYKEKDNYTEEEMENCNKYFIKLLENKNYFLDQPKNAFVNINMSNVSIKVDLDTDITEDALVDSHMNIKQTFVGKGSYNTKFVGEIENTLKYETYLDTETFEDGCDNDAIHKGYTSISFVELLCNRK